MTKRTFRCILHKGIYRIHHPAKTIVFSTIALSFAPIVIFFMITSDNYAFLKLLHVAIFTFSGIFAVKTIIDGLTFSCKKKNIYQNLA